MFKNYVGYGLLIGHLLKEKGVVLRKRKNVGNDRYLFKVVGSTSSSKRARTSYKPVAVGPNAQEDDPELDVAEAIRLVRINEVYFNKLGKKRDQQVAADKGKGKIMPDVEREGEEQTDPVKGILPKFTEKRENENEAGINEVLRVLVDSQNQLKNELERTSDMQQYFKFRKLRSEYERLAMRGAASAASGAAGGVASSGTAGGAASLGRREVACGADCWWLN
nr:uncharacterized protein LOC109192376 [Ipomoea batatas]